MLGSQWERFEVEVECVEFEFEVVVFCAITGPGYYATIFGNTMYRILYCPSVERAAALTTRHSTV
jgi:hypothetical protein